MDAPPERIVTKRLILRRPKPEDGPAKYENSRDPAVNRYMGWTPHATLQDAIYHVERTAARWVNGEEYSWVITEKPSDVAIGSIACHPQEHAVELGYVLAKNQWGKGYATEAAKAVFEWVVAQQDVFRVWANCDIENVASMRVLEKLGMSREGVLRRWRVRPNLAPRVPRDAVIYAWVRECE